MTQFPRPPEGTWTQHYPTSAPVRCRMRTAFLRSSTSGSGAVFGHAWLNVARVEEVARPGQFLTKDLRAAKTSVIVVRDTSGRSVRSTTCVGTAATSSCGGTTPGRSPAAAAGSSPASTTAGATTWMALQLRAAGVRVLRSRPRRHGLVPVHCDVWAGFVFVNLAQEPEQSLREFLGPMVTALEGYPFDRLTERYDFRADIACNWKIFADAFQEYYHVPMLHPQEATPATRAQTQRWGSRRRTTSSTVRTAW